VKRAAERMPAPSRALRLAQAADVPALALLYARSASLLGPQVYSLEQVLAWQAFGRDTAAFRDYVLLASTWMAEDASGPLGFCGIAADGEVHSLYVHPAWIRRGLGGRLLGDALTRARGRGQQRFAAWVTPFSRPVFERARFGLVRTVVERYQGVDFERYRVEWVDAGAAAAPHGDDSPTDR